MSKVKDQFNDHDIDYEKILSDLDIGFYKGALQGGLLKHNLAFNKILGYDPSESLIGNEASQFLIYPDEIKMYYTELMEKGFVKNLILNIKDKNGTAKVIQLNSRLILNEEGEPIEVEGTFVDVTEKYETTRKLKELKELYRLISECAKDVIFTLDMNMKFTYISPYIYDLLGYTPEEMVKKTIKKYNTPSSLKIIANAFKEEFKLERNNITVLNRVRNLEVQQIHKNGSIIDIEIICTFLRDEDGKPTGIFGVSRDITERKITERKSKESEEKFRTITEQFLVGIAIIQDNEIKYANEQILELTGYTMDEIKDWGPQGFAKVIHPEDRSFVMNQMKKKQKGEKNVVNRYEMRIIKKNSDIVWMDNYSSTIMYNGNPADLAILVDITQQKELLNARIESEEKFHGFFDFGNIGMAITSIDKKWVYCNDQIIEMLGFTREELLEKSWAELTYPEDLQSDVEQFNNVLDGKIDSYQMDKRFIKKNGQIVYTHLTVSCIRNSDGTVKHILATLQDITERKKTAQKLKESEVKYRHIYEESPISLSLVNSKGIILDINPATEKIYGYKKDEMIGKNYVDLGIYTSDQISLFKKRFEKYLEGKKLKSIELQIRKKDGSLAWINYQSSMIKKDNEILIQAIAQDITEKKEIEIQLKDSEEKYRKLFADAPDGISILDSKGYIVDCNITDQKQIGFDYTDIIGKHITTFMTDDSKLLYHQNFPILQKEGKVHAEIELIQKNRNVIPVWRKVTATYDDTGRFSGAIVHSRDITDRKKAEKATKESEEKYRILFESSPVGIGFSDFDGKILAANKKLQDILGYSFVELKNLDVRATYVDQNDRKKILNMLKESGKIYNFEVDLKKKDGTTFLGSLNIELLEIGGKKVFLSNIEDITKQKNAEKKIVSLARFPSENPNPVLRVDEDKILYINVAGRRLFNLTEGNNIPYILQEVVNTVITKKFSKVWEIGLNDRIYLFEITPIKEEGYINIYGRDITEQKISEEALKTVKEFTDNVLDTSIDTIFVFEPETGRAIRWNEAFRDISGYTDDEIASLKAPDSYYSDEDLKKAAEATQRALEEGRTTFEMSLITKDGHSIPFEYTGRTFKSLDGDLLIVAVGRDFTERKRAEEKLKESEEKYRLISENANDLIVVLNQKYVIEYVNKASLNVLNFLSDEMIGKTPKDFVHPDDYERAINALNKGFKEGEGKAELRLKNKNGHYIWFDIKGGIFIDKDGENKGLIILRDVSERKESEEVLKESEKKYRDAYNRASFYKELIAHDMNNILQSIHSSVELHKLSIEKPDLFKDKKDFLSTITENVFRGSQIASNVIKLSELEELKIPLEIVNVNKNLMDAIVFIHKIYQTRNLNINVETLKEDHFALANNLILDLFENILLNSVKHNINPVIEIQVIISDVQLDNKKYSKIEFIDNAAGIPDERKESIFHRREKNGTSSKGMGIGLSLVKQIVDSFNGKIWVENKVKEDHTKGSNFIVLIPKTT